MKKLILLNYLQLFELQVPMMKFVKCKFKVVSEIVPVWGFVAKFHIPDKRYGSGAVLTPGSGIWDG
jgi:hypothetical protein